MGKWSRLRLGITRNWGMPGKERIASWLIHQSRNADEVPFEGITWLKNENLAVNISTSSYIEWKILAEGTYESATGNLISLSLLPGDWALDIGANIGIHSLRMAKAVGSGGRVISCEPLAHLRKKLQANLTLNRLEQQVVIMDKAISDVPGKTQMSGDPASFNQGTGRMESTGSTEVEVITGDALLESLGAARLDLIKIDIEGYEMKAISGLKNSIRKYKPRILVEYDRDYWQKCGSSWDEFKTFLKSCNYSIYRIDDHTLSKIEGDPDVGSCNVFCLPDSLS